MCLIDIIILSMTLFISLVLLVVGFGFGFCSCGMECVVVGFVLLLLFECLHYYSLLISQGFLLGGICFVGR